VSVSDFHFRLGLERDERFALLYYIYNKTIKPKQKLKVGGIEIGTPK
jgi:hypothetical protein